MKVRSAFDIKSTTGEKANAKLDAMNLGDTSGGDVGLR